MKLSQLMLVFIIITIAMAVVLELKTNQQEWEQQQLQTLEQGYTKAVQAASGLLLLQLVQNSYAPEQIETELYRTFAAASGMLMLHNYESVLESKIPVICIITEEGYELGFSSAAETGSFKRQWTGIRQVERADNPNERILQYAGMLEQDLQAAWKSCVGKTGVSELTIDFPEITDSDWIRAVTSPGVLLLYLAEFRGRQYAVPEIYAAELVSAEAYHILEENGTRSFHYRDCPRLQKHYQTQTSERICFESKLECAEYGALAAPCCDPFCITMP